MTCPDILVVGGGLAGCEAAWQLAEAGIQVELAEMRPARSTPVHRTGNLAELVCSNSLRGDDPGQAVGLLKREMEALGSLLIRVARTAAVPAGGALAVDRDSFSAGVEAAIAEHSHIRLSRREITDLPSGFAIVATGPLTSPTLHAALETTLGEGSLAFFDAVAPIVAGDSLDRSSLFAASRYGKGGGEDYLNSPLDRDAYEDFIAALNTAQRVPLQAFEKEDIRYFEGCLPIEVMAERGLDTLRWGPMKPVGLIDPRTGRRPWAVAQLRQDDLAGEHWNLVGFQTKLTPAEQLRVLRMLPGLEQARFVRFGMIHRNTFVNAPRHLDDQLRLKIRPELRLAGQLTGVEGYVESAATGLLAGRLAAAELLGRSVSPPPAVTAHGALVRHLTARAATDFQPANISWGLMECPDELLEVRDKRLRRERHGRAAIETIAAWGGATPGSKRWG